MRAKAEARGEIPHVATATDTKGRRRGMRVSEAIEIIDLGRGLTPAGQREVLAHARALAAKTKAKP